MHVIENISKAGSTSIIPQRIKDWIRFCLDCYENNKSFIVKDIVLAMKLLDEKTMSYPEIEDALDFGQYTGRDWEIVEIALAKYHPLGVDFVRGTNGKIEGTKLDNYLINIKIENDYYLKENNKAKR